MVNFLWTIQELDRFARRRTTVTLPVNKLSTIRIGRKESSQILGLASASNEHPIPAWREPLLDDRRPMRLRPSEMLPSVEGDHLAGHRRRR